MAAKNLSKENLKNELIAHNIPLPPSGSKKEKYLELYEKHISPNENSFRPEFSSDEDDPGRSPKPRVKRSIFTSFTTSSNSSMEKRENTSYKNLIIDGLNISELSDDELRLQLSNFNVAAGPIVDTTRTVYERKLAKLLSGEREGDAASFHTKEDEYSDSEDETASHHSTNPAPISHSNRIPPITHEENNSDDKRTDIKYTPNDDSAFSRYNIARDSPTPRRSLRPNITYTPTDRKLLNSTIRERFANNSRKIELGKLASKVVEQVQEPVQPKRSIYITVLKVVAIIAVLLLIFLVYENMEANGGENVEKLPGESFQTEAL